MNYICNAKYNMMNTGIFNPYKEMGIDNILETKINSLPYISLHVKSTIDTIILWLNTSKVLLLYDH